jgi:hypothetical protein
VTLEKFKTAHPTSSRYRKIEPVSAECERESCKVQLRLTYDHPSLAGLLTLLDEAWVLDDGQLWYVWRL